mgnify:CR=1 FL=1
MELSVRALIREAVADAHGNHLDAAALLLDRCRDEHFVHALVREFAPQLREAAPTFSRLLDESHDFRALAVGEPWASLERGGRLPLGTLIPG